MYGRSPATSPFSVYNEPSAAAAAAAAATAAMAAAAATNVPSVLTVVQAAQSHPMQLDLTQLTRKSTASKTAGERESESE